MLAAGPASGTLVQNGNGSFTYTPNANFTGSDSFTYRVRDSAGALSNLATVSLTVLNQAPVAGDDSVSTPSNTPVTFDVRGNDSDPEGDALTVVLAAGPSSGTLADTIVRISSFDKILSSRAFSTLRILPLSGSIA